MRRFFGALAAAALVASLMAAPAVAHDIILGDTVAPNADSHETVPGNPKCGATPRNGFTLKIEAEDLHVGNYGPIRITAVNGTYVDWAIREAYLDIYDADVVIVKGGPNAVSYVYEDGDEDADRRLTAPRNPNGKQPKYYGISHIQFCFNPKGGVTPS